MATHFDDKGKIFTNVIAKRCIPAMIQLVTHRLHGNIHVREGERIKDELLRAEQFMAITDASLFDLQGKLLYECDFITINRDHIVWISPDSDRREPESVQEGNQQ